MAAHSLPAWLDSSASRSVFRRRLLAWYDTHRRALPWRVSTGRAEDDLYRTWVSEVMLQQTQVATVLGYYARFVNRFSSVEQLACADLQEVLLHWEGLGYYRRARQMHLAAKTIVAEHGGRLPVELDALVRLPGIGRYSAAAILSIALGQRHPIVEGNTQRVYSRLAAYREDPRSSTGQKAMWSIAEQLVTRHRPGDLNQALMELGAEVCTKTNPDCSTCPVRSFCAAREMGIVDQLPARSSLKTDYQKTREAAVVIRRASRVLLRRCQAAERWAGLWDFPRFSVPDRGASQYLARRVLEETGLTIKLGKPAYRLQHAVTRFRITLHGYVAQSVAGRLRRRSEISWVPMSRVASLPLCASGRQIADRFQAKL